LASILASKALSDAHAKPSTSNIDSIGNPPIYQVQRWVPSITMFGVNGQEVRHKLMWMPNYSPQT
jgi:hypothetical protein